MGVAKEMEMARGAGTIYYVVSIQVHVLEHFDFFKRIPQHSFKRST